MMDQFDAAARQVMGVGSEFEQAAANVMDDQRVKLRASLYSGLMENPDQVARAQSIGKTMGLPRDVVQRNLPEVERNLRMQQVTQHLQDTPTLARWLAEQDNAAIAHDDVENMGQIERKLRQFAGGAVEAVGMSVSGAGVLADVLQRTAINDFATIFLPSPQRGPMGLESQRPTLESLAGPLIGEGWREAGGEVKSLARDDLMVPADQRTFSDQVAGGLGQVVGQIAMLPFTRGAGLYAQGADVMAEKVASDDADQRVKDLAVLGGAMVTGVTEMWALDKLLGPMATPIKNQVAASLARVGIAAAAEGGQEFSENLLQDVIRTTLTNRDAEIDVGQSMEEGGVGAVVGGIVRSVVESALHIRVRGERQAQKAVKDAEAIEEMNKLAAADKVLQRNPEAFEQFIKQAAEDGPVPLVYIDARSLMQSGVAEQVANVSATVAEQLPEAVATGGQIAIPVEEYQTRIAPTEYAQSLVDHLKTEPDGFSRLEAQQFMESNQAELLQQEVERRLTEKQADDAFRQSQEAVKSMIQAELDAVGRFTPEKNEADATLFASYYAVRAAQLGMTPEQFYEQNRVRFAAQRLDGESDYRQGEPFTPTEIAMQRWRESLARTPANDSMAAAKLQTPAVLRAMGVKAGNIEASTSMLQQVMRKHPDVPVSVLENLPALLSDPDMVFGHREGGLSVVLSARTAKGEPIVVGVRDGRVRTVTPYNDSASETGQERLRAHWNAALQRDTKVYARNKEAPVGTGASAIGGYRANSVDRGSKSPASVLTRDRLGPVNTSEVHQRRGRS